MSAGQPNRCTGMTALTFGVSARLRASESIEKVFSWMSTKTGLAPIEQTAEAVAMLGNRIAAVGSSKDLRALAGPAHCSPPEA